ncbi:30S ribosomal protein S20 [Thermotoga profunda]|uniref:30S ribosomal protein S20 n=1 Tax=Thermotoga profunda TaxID=1508420 RepID=UPI000597E6ED|nr:30S ribosomal protein S20 [Thermotoga profunda]
MAKKVSKSVVKRAEEALKRKVRNRAYKTQMKNAIKKVLEAVKTKEPADSIDKLLKNAISTIDKAASKGIIHKNQAARRKSRLVKAIRS